MMEVGVARIDITPDQPIRLSGFGARTNAEADQVLRRLSTKVLAFGSDEQHPSLFITVDLIGIPRRITDKLVEQLSKKAKIEPSQVVICASHTHGGPEMGMLLNALQYRGTYPSRYYFDDSLLALDELLHIARYNELLAINLEKAALAALQNRKLAHVAWGMGEVSFAENRRTAGGPVDHALPVLRITRPDGILQAVLLNYACHGISLGPDVNEIHGDWMGEAQAAIEAQHPGAVAMVAIGCAGDLHPKQRDKPEYGKAYGREIAMQVDKILGSELQPLTEPPVGEMKWIKLPFSKVPDVGELIELTKDTSIKGYYARLALERVVRGESLPPVLDYPIQVWRFGDKMMMLNMGGEVVVDYSVRLKNKYGPKYLWINAYANDVSCYVASRRIIKEGGYEADASMYCYNQPSPFSEEIEERILNAISAMVPPKS